MNENNSTQNQKKKTRDNAAEIVYLSSVRKLKEAEDIDAEYEQMIRSMSKLELLDEMIRYQEERSRTEDLSLQMMVRGRHLFTALEENAETREMRLLARSYRRHLECELDQYRKVGR